MEKGVRSAKLESMNMDSVHAVQEEIEFVFRYLISFALNKISKWNTT